jgi:hypothetical protein
MDFSISAEWRALWPPSCKGRNNDVAALHNAGLFPLAAMDIIEAGPAGDHRTHMAITGFGA